MSTIPPCLCVYRMASDGDTIATATELSASEQVETLAELGLYDQALSSADIQKVDKRMIFESLTSRCLIMTDLSDEVIRYVMDDLVLVILRN